MFNFNILCFLSLVFSFLMQSDCTDCNQLSQSVSASLDGEIRLPCCDPTVSVPESYRIKWTNYSSGSSPKVILARPKTPKLPDAERVKWEDGCMSLLLSQVQKSDEGLYSCEIWSGWESILAKNISLKVKDCQSKVKTISPGLPITLNCSGINASAQNLSWSLLRGGNPVPLSTDRFKRNGTTLFLTSVFVNDSGWYRCKYMLEHRERCLDINLLIQDKGSPRESTTNANPATVKILQTGSGKGFTAVHSVPLILGIAMISALIGTAIYYKYYKKKRSPQQTQGNQEFMLDNVMYDVIDDLLYEDLTNQSSLQQQSKDEVMCTF